MPTPSSTAWSITPTGLTSTGKACGEPVTPAESPEPVALRTCRYAWTTQERCPHAHSRSSRKTSPPSRDSRLTTRHRRCQKPDSQNASRPGRHQIGRMGEIISESWARSNRNTRARSSESAENLEPRFDSIETEKALAGPAAAQPKRPRRMGLCGEVADDGEKS